MQEFIDLIREKPINDAFISGLEMNKSYQAMYSAYDEVMNGKDEDLKLDRIDRDRYIGYRLATALGIALIIFILYAIGSWAEISLPAMRL